MVLSELTMGLSSPEACFQAPSKEECYIELKNWRAKVGETVTALTVISVVEALSSTDAATTRHMRDMFSHLSILNMFTLIHVLYLQVFHLETSGRRCLSSTEVEHIATALHQWGQLWPSFSRDIELIKDTQETCDASISWQSVGFIRYAPEYWLLTRLTLEDIRRRPEAHHRQSPTRVFLCEDDDMAEAKALITQLKSTSGGQSQNTSNDVAMTYLIP